MFRDAYNDEVVVLMMERLGRFCRNRRRRIVNVFNFFLEHRERKIIKNNDKREENFDDVRRKLSGIVDSLFETSLQCNLFGDFAANFLKGNTVKNVLSISADAKTVKGETLGFLTGILYLAPATTTKWNTCPMAKIAQCDKACLYSAGRGAFSNVQQARIAKTVRFFEDRSGFMADVVFSINALIRKAAKAGLKPLVRLNGTSDIRWETVGLTVDGVDYANIFDVFPDVQFYDYTKDANRKDLPANYDLTFSYSGVESFQPYVEKAFNKGMRMAVVFRKEKDIPNTFKGIRVVSGDKSDVRHLDDDGVIVGLYAKGQAKLDDTGFVV